MWGGGAPGPGGTPEGPGWGGEEVGRLGPPLSARARLDLPHTSCGSPGPWVSLSLFPVPTRPAGAAEGGWPPAPSLPPLCPSAAPWKSSPGRDTSQSTSTWTPPRVAAASRRWRQDGDPGGGQEGTGACPPAPQVTRLLCGSGTSDPLKHPARPARLRPRLLGLAGEVGCGRGGGASLFPVGPPEGASSSPLLVVPTLFFFFLFPLPTFYFSGGF